MRDQIQTSSTLCPEKIVLFLFDRWLGETHSLSGRNDKKNNVSPSRESGIGRAIRCPVHMLIENSTSDMWICYFYTALLFGVHFPITYSIIIIIIIIIINVVAFVIVLIIWNPLIQFIRALYSVRKFYVVNFTHKRLLHQYIRPGTDISKRYMYYLQRDLGEEMLSATSFFCNSSIHKEVSR
jgi:hypothetical protein